MKKNKLQWETSLDNNPSYIIKEQDSSKQAWISITKCDRPEVGVTVEQSRRPIARFLLGWIVSYNNWGM